MVSFYSVEISVGSSCLAQDAARLPASVNTVVNLRVP
jgi:hypothetical protein